MSIVNGIGNMDYQALASGKRINSASDDAAGLAIAKKMESEERALTAASENAGMGISAVNTADGAMNGIMDYLQSIHEVGIRAMNGLYSESDRQSMQMEINGYMSGIEQLARGTRFNEHTLLNGSMASMNIANNPNGTGMKIQMENSTLSALGLNGFSVMGDFDLSVIDKAISTVSNARSGLGASANALEHSVRYSNAAAEQQTASRSRLEDLDMAEAISEKKKDETLQNYRIMMQKKQMEQGSFINKLFT